MSVPWYLMAKGKGGGSYKTASGPIVSVNDALAASLRSLVANIEPVQAGSGDPSPYNVRPISGWSECKVWVKPAYDPTANPTATLQLGQTVYGGTLDVTNGVLTVDRAMVDLGTLSWNKDNNRIGNYYTSNITATPAPKMIGFAVACSQYAVNNLANANTIQNGEISSFNSYGQPRVFIKDIANADLTGEQFTAAMSGVQLVYELATPIEIPLTATQISLLAGQNALWADSGDVTVEYLSSGGTDPDLMKLAVAFMGRK